MFGPSIKAFYSILIKVGILQVLGWFYSYSCTIIFQKEQGSEYRFMGGKGKFPYVIYSILDPE